MTELEFQNTLDQLSQEEEALKNSIALNKILHSLLVESKKEKLRQWIVILCLILVIISGIISFFVYESQFEIEDTETQTQTTYSYAEASGDSAAINNVQGDQYNDQATRNNYYDDEE